MVSGHIKEKVTHPDSKGSGEGLGQNGQDEGH
jgi:hypothetical protein